MCGFERLLRTAFFMACIADVFWDKERVGNNFPVYAKGFFGLSRQKICFGGAKRRFFNAEGTKKNEYKTDTFPNVPKGAILPQRDSRPHRHGDRDHWLRVRGKFQQNLQQPLLVSSPLGQFHPVLRQRHIYFSTSISQM